PDGVVVGLLVRWRFRGWFGHHSSAPARLELITIEHCRSALGGEPPAHQVGLTHPLTSSVALHPLAEDHAKHVRYPLSEDERERPLGKARPLRNVSRGLASLVNDDRSGRAGLGMPPLARYDGIATDTTYEGAHRVSSESSSAFLFAG